VQNEASWRDCVSAHDPDSLVFYTRTQLPVFSWSALAGGFFAGCSGPEVERVYASDANRERLCRAEALGRLHGWSANQVALAWVLHQAFPTFAIIGPASPMELDESLAALAVDLTPADVRWLDLEEDE
jgi:1-deoxyxylulose-5-phosphate synthase